MHGHKWEYFCLQLSFIGWYLLVIMTCGIALIYLGLSLYPNYQCAILSKLGQDNERTVTS